MPDRCAPFPIPITNRSPEWGPIPRVAHVELVVELADGTRQTMRVENVAALDVEVRMDSGAASLRLAGPPSRPRLSFDQRETWGFNVTFQLTHDTVGPIITTEPPRPS